MSSYTAHIFPDTNSDGETVLSLAIDGEASYYHGEDVRVIINFSCQHSMIRFIKLLCIHQVVEFFRINSLSMIFSTSALRPMWLTTPGMNISVGFEMMLLLLYIMFASTPTDQDNQETAEIHPLSPWREHEVLHLRH